MIVVVGIPGWRSAESPGPAGRAAAIAIAAAAQGAQVQLVGRVGDDPAGDALMIALARAGVGHVAVLRDAAVATPVVSAAPEEDPASELDGRDRAATHTADGSRPVPSLEPADVSLGLQYLNSFSVLVVSDEVSESVRPVAAEAASFAGAHLVVLVPAGSAPGALPEDATVLEAPEGEDAAFATVVGAYAAALDGGADPSTAFTGAIGRVR